MSASNENRPLTAREEAKWSAGVMVNGGGYATVRVALAAKRKPGLRSVPAGAQPGNLDA